MPYNSKKKRFRGTPWKMTKEKVENELEVTNTTSTGTGTSHGTSLKSGISPVNQNFYDLDCNERSQGYCLIDLSCLNEALKDLHQCQGASLTVVDTGSKNGLCSTLAFMCLKCGEKSVWNTSRYTSNHTSPGKTPFDVNRHATYAVSEIGLGREGLATFCGIMGMPLPLDTSAWHAQVKAVNNIASSEFEKDIERSATRLRKVFKEEGNQEDADIDPEDFSKPIEVAVSFDGTWHHRGFKSSHGVVLVMSADTGEVLDAEVLSKDCSICSKNINADDAWKEIMSKVVYARRIVMAPSTSMETQAARVL